MNYFLEDIILQYLENEMDAITNLISLFLNAVMNEEAKMQVGAGEYERNSSRKAHCNGYRTRSLKTRYGTVTLDKPQIREFPFKTLVFDRYSRVEKATRNAIITSLYPRCIHKTYKGYCIPSRYREYIGYQCI